MEGGGVPLGGVERVEGEEKLVGSATILVGNRSSFFGLGVGVRGGGRGNGS